MAGMLQRMPFLLLLALLPALASPCLAGKYRVIAKLPTGIGPGSLELTPDGTRVAVCNSDSGDLSVFRLSDLSVAPTIPVGRVPVALTFDRSGAALVACFRDDALYRVDLDAGEVRGKVSVGDGPRDVAMTADGRALVPGYYDGVLAVVDPQTMAEPRKIQLALGASQVLTVPGSKQALVLNTSSDRLHMVDPAQEQPAGELDDKLGYGLWHAQLTPDGKRLLVSGWVSNTLAVVSTSPAMSYALIPLSGKGSCQLAVAPDGKRAYVAHSESDTLVVVDLVGLREVGSVTVGRFPFSYVAVSPDGADVLVTNDKDGTVSVVDAATLTVRQVIPVGSIPRQILFVGNRALVTCAFSNHMAVLERE